MQPIKAILLFTFKSGQFRNIILFLLSWLIIQPAVIAQDTAAAKHAAMSHDTTVYVQFVYIKTHQVKTDQYLDLLKNYTSKSIETELKAGKILGWYVNTVSLPTGSSAEYDVVIVTVTNHFKTLFNDSITGKAFFKKSFPEYNDAVVDDIMKQYTESRTIVKREIFTAIAEIDPKAPPTKYASVDFMKATPGMEARYVKMEKDTFSVLHKERAKMGVIKDWVFIAKTLPYSSGDTYDYVTANFFDDVSVLLDGKYEAAAKAAYPGHDVSKMASETGALRTTVKTELWKLENYVDHSNTK